MSNSLLEMATFYTRGGLTLTVHTLLFCIWAIAKRIQLIKVGINGLRPTLTNCILLLLGKQEGNA